MNRKVGILNFRLSKGKAQPMGIVNPQLRKST